MSDLLAGFGIFLIIEGLIWALLPRETLRTMITALAQSERTLEVAGWLLVVAGIAIVWLARG